MKDVVRCPGCLAGFRFPGDPPLRFTCPTCGAEMDLSAYAPARPAVVVAPVFHATVPPVVVTPPALPPVAEAPHVTHAHGHRHHPRAHRNPGMMLLVGGVIVCGIGVAFAVVHSHGTEATLSPAERLRRSASEEEAARLGTLPREAQPTLPTPPPVVAQPTPPPSERPARRPRRAPTDGERPADDQPARPAVRETQVQSWPYPPDVTAEEQSRIEAAITSALEVGGSDGIRAEKLLVSLGLKAAPRLISQFKTILDQYGLDKEEGLSRAMVIDRTLRKIDGVQERRFGDLKPIHPNSDPKSALQTVRNWNWWWESEEYRKHPQKPWDPTVDEQDDR